MSKPRMYGAFTPYTPNRKMDLRFNRKRHERSRLIADKDIARGVIHNDGTRANVTCLHSSTDKKNR